MDVVVIGTPCYQHGPMTLEALQAGKHVYRVLTPFVEVPLTNSSFANAFQILKTSEYTGLPGYREQPARLGPSQRSHGGSGP